MSKYFQFILVILYALLTVTAIFIVIDLFGLVHKGLHDYVVVLTITAWLFFCFSAAFFLTDIWLLFQEVRKPLRAEEQRLGECLVKLQQKAGDTTTYRFRIQEEPGFNAFAVGHHTIVVSKGLLASLADDELTAVLAHELGHLRTGDTIAGMAYTCATYVPRTINRCFKKGLLAMTLLIRIGLTGGIIGLLVILFLLYYFHVFHYLIAAVIFIVFITALEWLFLHLWLLNSRQTEYRQDAFAHQLGYGEELRGVLLRMAENMPHKVSFFYTLTSTHPVIFNRIRRLERMEEAA